MVFKQVLSLSLTGALPHNESKKLYTFLKLLWLSLLVNAVFTIVDLILAKNGLMEPRRHPGNAFIEEETILWRLFVLFVFRAITNPLFEELSFRLALSQKKRDVMWGLSFLTALLLTFFTDIESLARPYFWFMTHPVVFVLLGGLTFLLLRPLARKVSEIHEFSGSETSLKWLLLGSAVLFSFIHVFVSPTTEYWFLYPIIYGRFFVAAYIFAFARLSLGFWYAVACHGAYNGLLFLMTILRN
ncbi:MULTISPECIES: CPBP family glutamic-type intramembrane protease [unclassified Imperialibacter]|uniref:CPBP family glutamic-type intramembrane protease n=1 Tax=unclassified Imperialibacter TaxID=2629706 RepID=UPI00125540F2|nr:MULTISPECIES: CPBP family glutamic-type intramembrane protease [unclassified Imperialibacter]CAD5267310.1 membrane hypothetical protein [Imperialibacter sp. 89]CAD5295695.1 membrane hypothetical protein [Imperialibacter sp. 75]VVT33581.1 membrane hypothetical protein [Imperialibacter sp. EC-SDR9]